MAVVVFAAQQGETSLSILALAAPFSSIVFFVCAIIARVPPVDSDDEADDAMVARVVLWGEITTQFVVQQDREGVVLIGHAQSGKGTRERSLTMVYALW